MCHVDPWIAYTGVKRLGDRRQLPGRIVATLPEGRITEIGRLRTGYSVKMQANNMVGDVLVELTRDKALHRSS